MKYFCLSVLLLVSLSCQSLDYPDNSLSEWEDFFVVDILPDHSKSISTASSFHVQLSQPVDIESISSDSFYVIQLSEGDNNNTITPLLSKKEVIYVSGLVSVKEDFKEIIFSPDKALTPDQNYGLVITSALKSQNKLRLSVTEKQVLPIIIAFHVSNTPEESNAAIDDNSVGGSGNSESGITQPPQETTPLAEVKLNEIYYDAPASDTDGDLFVELMVVTAGRLQGFSLLFINGDNGAITGQVKLDSSDVFEAGELFVVADSINGSASKTHVANASQIANFDPQNGPDAIQLVGVDGELVDVIAYGEIAVAVAENGLEMVHGSPAEDIGAGYSLSRLIDAADLSDNSLDFVSNSNPSPGTFDVTP